MKFSFRLVLHIFRLADSIDFLTSEHYSIGKICDMIKGNVSDVGNIDIELQAKISDKCLCMLLFLNFKESVISLQPSVRLRCGLDQNVAF